MLKPRLFEKNQILSVCLSIGLVFALELPVKSEIYKIEVGNDNSETTDFYRSGDYKSVPIYGNEKKGAKIAAYQKLLRQKLCEQQLEFHTAIGTYYSTKNNLMAILMFNNKVDAPLFVTVMSDFSFEKSQRL